MTVDLADVPSAPSQTDDSGDYLECGGDVVLFGGDELACSESALVLSEALMSRGSGWETSTLKTARSIGYRAGR